jgi:anaerobic magnesium-protoporphyrin IX monomethyl ester cyclase
MEEAMPTDLDLMPTRKHPGEFQISLDDRITHPESLRVSFLILLDGDLVMSPEHLGVAYMASVLRTAGFTAEIREVRHVEHDQAVEALAAFQPAMVCFTLMSLNVATCVELCERIDRQMPDTIIVCGGPAGTFAGADVLRSNPYVDLVAVGEGEPIILDLAQRMYLGQSLTDTPGVCVRDEAGAIHANPPRPLIHNLESLPFPARDQLEQHGNKLEYVRVSTSRGCVAHCTFCSAPHLKNRVQSGKAWRGRGPEHIVDEIAHLVERYKFRTYDFIDSTFEDPDGGRVGKKRVTQIASLILERGLDIYYNVCMRAENWKDTPADNELMDLLVRSGLEKVNVGIESGVPEELLLWEKRATVEDNITIIRMLREHGIYLAMGFIPFHPYATAESLIQNAAFLRDNAGHNLRRMTERLEIYPGTNILRRIENDGLLDEKYWATLDPYGYEYKDARVGLLAKHYASLYNNEDYHEHGVITEQSAVFEFETFNVVLQTFISRCYRRFNCIPGAVEVITEFKNWLHRVRQEMGQYNYAFFIENLNDVLNDSLDNGKRRAQVLDVEQYFYDRIRLIKSEQLRVGKALHRLGAHVAEISSSLPPVLPGGAQRSYTGEGTGATW